MARWIGGAAAAALVMMVWGMLWWTVLPFASEVMQPIPNQDTIGHLLGQGIDKSGAYYLPAPIGDETYESESYAARHEAGPLALVFFVKEGQPAMQASTCLKGYALCFVTAFVLGGLLLLAQVRGFARRVGVVFLGGSSGVVLANIAYPIWFYHDPAYWVVTTLYMLLSVFLAGLVLAAVIRS